tara:strand:+ start:147 stop:770 length:624 start_codon:yes stop_codon:yes gene_type:complete
MPQQESIETRTLSQFKSALISGGARPNLFEVQVDFPNDVDLGIQGDNDATMNDTDVQNKFRFLCKAAALPASNVANIDIPFRGRTFKVAGDRTVETWTITVINDEQFNHYKSFQAWSQNIGQYGDSSGLVNPNDYMGNATVYQLGRSKAGSESAATASTSDANRILAEYKFVDIWPSTVSNIDLSYDSSDTIEEFTVDFQVQYWYPV